jgi:hypothetical protein
MYVSFQYGQRFVPIGRLRDLQNNIIDRFSLWMCKAYFEGGGAAVGEKGIKRAEGQTQVYDKVVIGSQETVFAGAIGQSPIAQVVFIPGLACGGWRRQTFFSDQGQFGFAKERFHGCEILQGLFILRIVVRQHNQRISGFLQLLMQGKQAMLVARSAQKPALPQTASKGL